MDPKRIREHVDVLQGDVPLASLDRPQIRSVQAGEVGQCLLREAALESERAKRCPEREAMV
jgi:hypothetical protein